MHSNVSIETLFWGLGVGVIFFGDGEDFLPELLKPNNSRDLEASEMFIFGRKKYWKQMGFKLRDTARGLEATICNSFSTPIQQ